MPGFPPKKPLYGKPKPATSPLAGRKGNIKKSNKPKPAPPSRARPTPRPKPSTNKGRQSTAGKVPPFNKLTVVQQQRHLKQMGYNVLVDGIVGPQTRAARKAYLTGVGPKKFNALGIQPGGKVSANSGSSGPATSAPTKPNGPGAKPTAKPPAAKKKAAPKAPAATSIAGGFDPASWIQQQQDAYAAAQQAAFQSAMNGIAAQQKAAMADLGSWGAQVSGQHTQDAAATAAMWQQAQQGQQAADTNVGNLFGEANAQAVGDAAAPKQELLAALAGNSGAFDNQMNAILQQQTMDYQNKAMHDFMQQRYALESQRQEQAAAAIPQFAQLQLSAMDQQLSALNQQQQYEIAKQGLAQAAALNPYEVATAKANANRAKSEAQSAAAEASASTKMANLALKKSRAELALLYKQAQGGFDWSDPSTPASIANAAFTGALGPRGAFVIRPDIAYKNAQRLLGLYGIANDPRAVKAVHQQFQVALNISHARRMWGAWRINKNGQLIRDPSKKFQKGDKTKK